MININQAGALAGSITPGDTPGFPVRITVPGSYRLTSNLEVPSGVTRAIEIVTSHVTIDLAGHVISRKKAELDAAIYGSSERANFVKICNGHIRASGGVDLAGVGNRVQDLQLEGPDPSAVGVQLGDLGVAIDNQVSNVDAAFVVGRNGFIGNNVALNVGHGARAGENSIVSGNSLDSGAAQAAVRIGDGSILAGNIVGRNDGGVQAGLRCLIKENTLFGNGDFGISTGEGSVVSANRVGTVRNGPGISAGPGSTVADNAVTACGIGIQATSGTLMQSNAVSNCTGFGLKMGANSGYTDNVLNANNGGGAQVSGGMQIDKNECNGAFCP